ncbi:MAG: hypothetical protein II200_02625 [Bacteroidaceae bacterium]|nr:hypothetical protein [Bacteroidaceae bacterium]
MSTNKHARKSAHAAKEKQQARKVLFGLLGAILALGVLAILAASLI